MMRITLRYYKNTDKIYIRKEAKMLKTLLQKVFTKRCPGCGMKEKKGSGNYSCGEWFCSEGCHKDWEKRTKEAAEKYKELPPCCRK